MQHPRPKDNQTKARRQQLRDKGQRHFLDLRDDLQDTDKDADNHAEC